jgi:hypothetical protein
MEPTPEPLLINISEGNKATIYACVTASPSAIWLIAEAGLRTYKKKINIAFPWMSQWQMMF